MKSKCIEGRLLDFILSPSDKSKLWAVGCYRHGDFMVGVSTLPWTAGMIGHNILRPRSDR